MISNPAYKVLIFSKEHDGRRTCVYWVGVDKHYEGLAIASSGTVFELEPLPPHSVYSAMREATFAPGTIWKGG